MFEDIESLGTGGFGGESPGEGSLVLAAGLRIGRNDAGVCFPHTADSTALEEVKERVVSAVQEAGSPNEWEITDVGDLDVHRRSYLVERGLMSEMFADFSGGHSALEHRALGVYRGGVASLEINGKDHVRLLGYRTQENLEDIWGVLDPLDDAVEKGITYAFSEERGYLTADPREAGTAMKAEATLFLPVLMVSGRIEGLAKDISNRGLVLSPLMGGAGGLFLISNRGRVDMDETDMVDLVGSASHEAERKERALRRTLFRDQPLRVRDYIGRALGVLKYARSIDTVEAWSLIAAVQLGCELGIIEEELSAAEVFSLMRSIQPGHMVVEHMGQENDGLEDPEMDSTRAQILRGRFSAMSIRE